MLVGLKESSRVEKLVVDLVVLLVIVKALRLVVWLVLLKGCEWVYELVFYWVGWLVL